MENKKTLVSTKPMILKTEFTDGSSIEITLHPDFEPNLTSYIKEKALKAGHIFTQEDIIKYAQA